MIGSRASKEGPPVERPRIPCATYRVQFTPDFTFRDAAALVDYLSDLGITDLYVSPMLQAPPDSQHGYDVCNQARLNPALGGEEGFATLVQALQERGMGLLLDMVPNHMGVADECNGWWMDVLENGPGSRYARYFDIDWHPVKPEMGNKVLLPILEDQYGQVLENGKLKLEYTGGSFYIRYHDARLPLAPRSYIDVLSRPLGQLEQTLGKEDEHFQEMQSILTALSYLPEPTVQDPEKLDERNREKEIVKRRIDSLYNSSTDVRAALDETTEDYNGVPGDPHSFDLLDALIGAQSYRLAFWRVAGEEINFRRFFDINSLAAIRVELPEVFQATHDLVLRLLAEGQATGLRIDHPDGLWEPAAYFETLQESYLAYLREQNSPDAPGEEAAQRTPAEPASPPAASPDPRPLYVVAEKILSENEPLPRDWTVYGTTGYDFLASVNGLFAAPENEKAFDRLYARFTGQKINFDDLIISTKMAVMSNALASEINALAHELERLAEHNRHYRDFTLRGLLHGLRDVIACLAVYRTYINAPAGIVAPRDMRFIEAAVRDARRRSSGTDESVFRFVRDTLLLRNIENFTETSRPEVARVVMKFQQLTGPVMAKGVEDTAFYIYNRLASLNEVGSDPRQFGNSVAEFHRQNAERRQHWPHSLLATSTHDNKRSEDVRARINVLSEMPETWRKALTRWNRVNTSHKTVLGNRRVPDRNDEYLLYQTLLGSLDAGSDFMSGQSDPPAPGPAPQVRFTDEYRKRIAEYMGKATREAKVHTSWINPNEEYDKALVDFTGAILRSHRHNRFPMELGPLLHRVAYYGQFNSLSQLLLKLTAPGVPDIYQGNELWDFSLVDPDNRRPVDYKRRRRWLAELTAKAEEAGASGNGLEVLVHELIEHSYDGRIKLYVTYRALTFRRSHCDLFTTGDYFPLEAAGRGGDHLVAFIRSYAQQSALIVVPRLVVGLGEDTDRPPLGAEVWADTSLALPAGDAGRTYQDIFTGRKLTVDEQDGAPVLRLADILESFPVALLST